MIAVVGATGKTGRAVVSELKELGQDPICIVRDLERAHAVLGEKARIKLAEITDREALEHALQGVKRVFLVTGHNPQMAEQQITVLEAARAAPTPQQIPVCDHQLAHQFFIMNDQIVPLKRFPDDGIQLHRIPRLGNISVDIPLVDRFDHCLYIGITCKQQTGRIRMVMFDLVEEF